MTLDSFDQRDMCHATTLPGHHVHRNLSLLLHGGVQGRSLACNDVDFPEHATFARRFSSPFGTRTPVAAFSESVRALTFSLPVRAAFLTYGIAEEESRT